MAESLPTNKLAYPALGNKVRKISAKLKTLNLKRIKPNKNRPKTYKYILNRS